MRTMRTPPALREPGAPTAVTIAAPVNAPDFARTLGVQLSVLAKDGIQQAELHLNPAEMGPVSVQIVMEGTQARIDFGADVAATRHAIEAGLPALAGALRDAGFTLAGGGVSQHAGQRGDGRQAGDQGTPRGARTASDEAVARVATAARRIVTPGGVDLYA
jgi:flagellar hook-length control protein FliK